LYSENFKAFSGTDFLNFSFEFINKNNGFECRTEPFEIIEFYLKLIDFFIEDSSKSNIESILNLKTEVIVKKGKTKELNLKDNISKNLSKMDTKKTFEQSQSLRSTLKSIGEVENNKENKENNKEINENNGENEVIPSEIGVLLKISLENMDNSLKISILKRILHIFKLTLGYKSLLDNNLDELINYFGKYKENIKELLEKDGNSNENNGYCCSDCLIF
jgi:hypothetical protein